MFRRVLAVLVVACAAGTAMAMPAAASCALDGRTLDDVLAAADVVFVGTVADVRHDTTAQFDVEEVWKGDVPARVTVQGGPDGPGIATSVDRSWRPGTRYLVVPRVVAGELRDDQCSPTREWTDELEEFRPATAGPPQSVMVPSGPSDGTVVAVAAGVLALAVAGTAVVVRPRRKAA